MKALFIGGTGTISSAITRLVSKNPDWQLFLLNRGNRISEVPEGVTNLIADIDDELRHAFRHFADAELI